MTMSFASVILFTFTHRISSDLWRKLMARFSWIHMGR